MTEEKRIVVVVAETVQVEIFSHLTTRRIRRTIPQDWGRAAAQVAHVVSKMRVSLDRVQEHNARTKGKKKGIAPGLISLMKFSRADDIIPITTVILGARNSDELWHVVTLLNKAFIPIHAFHDQNPKIYGIDGLVLTAICTEPIESSRLVGITDYLPLWLCNSAVPISQRQSL